jgi:bisphosphoglycerate-independent phosphoglycerate mutase (AlkP superfamily)
VGHSKNWSSTAFVSAVEYVFDNLKRLLNVLPEDYVAIITTDHGGGGDKGAADHGSTADVDMTIPFFMIGKHYQAGKQLSNVSILDVAPTVVDVLGVEAEEYWTGTSLADKDKGSFSSYLNP